MTDDDLDNSAVASPAEELNELLEELRVMLPGTEVLFGFLLTVPFSNRFTEINQRQETTYFIAVVAVAVSTVLLIAPSAIHRIQRHPDEQHMKQLLTTSTVLAVLGSVALAITLSAVIFLVTDIIYDVTAAAVFAAAIAAMATTLWFALPLYRRLRK